jgi:hypothetical protein
VFALNKPTEEREEEEEIQCRSSACSPYPPWRRRRRRRRRCSVGRVLVLYNPPAWLLTACSLLMSGRNGLSLR